MSGKEGSGGFRKRKHDNFPHGQRREEKENVNPPSALMTSFKSFQLELDTRHDKYERLVKLSRDITIESKRTIFLLHRFTSAPNGEEILRESEGKLDAVRQKIKQVAQELTGEDMYQFHRAISPGLQEYVEAVSFQYFIKTRSLISVEEINKQLIFTAEDREETTNMATFHRIPTLGLKAREQHRSVLTPTVPACPVPSSRREGWHTGKDQVGTKIRKEHDSRQMSH
uniref:DISC1 scaffold protein n=1 Tax=Taeniopygia guttata TaxID=59729 RepID=A0A674H134_TAEGU